MTDPVEPTGALGAGGHTRRWTALLMTGTLLQGCAILALPVDLRAQEQQDSEPPAAAPALDTMSLEDLVKRGNEARHAGQMRAAIALFQKARDRAPHSYEIRVLLADTLRRVGESERALPEYEAAQRIDPARPEGYTGKALILRTRYDDEAAAALLQDGLARVEAGHRSELLLVLAETRRRERRLDEAARLFGEILEAHAQDAPARAGLARVAEDRGDLDGAIQAWDAYLGTKADDEAAALRRQELRELRASIEALRRTAARRGADANVLIELGRLLFVAGDAQGAAGSYRKALRIDPEKVEARRGLAVALRETGSDGALEAAREFRRLLKRRPADGVALYSLLGLAIAGGKAEDEEAAWRALVLNRPDDLFALRGWTTSLERRGPEVLARAIEEARAGDDGLAAPIRLRRLTLLLATAGRFPEAADAMYRMLLLDPTDPWSLEIANDVLFLDPGLQTALADRLGADLKKDTTANGTSVPPDSAAPQVLLARLAWWAGRGEEALVILRQAVAAHPGSALVHSALGEAYQGIAGRSDLAVTELHHAVALDPARPAAHVDLALTLLRMGRSKQSEAAARRCLERAPDLSPALSVLGAALADQGKFESAASAYAAALLADPADNFGLARGQLPIVLAALGRNVEARRNLRGAVPPIPEMLYREAWAFARDSCRDRAFNGQNWLTWRTRYRGALRTENDAYRAITAMLSSLGSVHAAARPGGDRGAVPDAARFFGRNRPARSRLRAEQDGDHRGAARRSRLHPAGQLHRPEPRRRGARGARIDAPEGRDRPGPARQQRRPVALGGRDRQPPGRSRQGGGPGRIGRRGDLAGHRGRRSPDRQPAHGSGGRADRQRGRTAGAHSDEHRPRLARGRSDVRQGPGADVARAPGRDDRPGLQQRDARARRAAAAGERTGPHAPVAPSGAAGRHTGTESGADTLRTHATTGAPRPGRRVPVEARDRLRGP